MQPHLRILLLTVLIQSCFCGLYYTTVLSNEVYYYNFTSLNATVIAPNQPALAKIANNNQKVFWVSAKNIMFCTKNIWLDTSIFAKTETTINKHISAMYASSSYLYWSIGNIIYSKLITGTTVNTLYTSPNTTTIISSVTYSSSFDNLIFANSSTFLYLIDISTLDFIAIDYSSILQSCGVIYDIRVLGGAIFIVTNGEKRGYGCIFKGSIQDLENLKLVQQTGLSRFDLIDIPINSTSTLSLHRNANCLTQLFYDNSRFCVPESLGYLGGASFDIDT